MNMLMSLVCANTFGMDLDEDEDLFQSDDLAFLRQIERELDARTRAARRRSANNAKEQARIESEKCRRRVLKAFMRVPTGASAATYESDFITNLNELGVNSPVDKHGWTAVHTVANLHYTPVFSETRSNVIDDDVMIVGSSLHLRPCKPEEVEARTHLFETVMGAEDVDLFKKTATGDTAFDVAFKVGDDERLQSVDLLTEVLRRKGKRAEAKQISAAFAIAHAARLVRDQAPEAMILEAEEEIKERILGLGKFYHRALPKVIDSINQAIPLESISDDIPWSVFFLLQRYNLLRPADQIIALMASQTV